MPTTVAVTTTAECRVCGAMIEERNSAILECPSCEGLQEFIPRRRPDGKRPSRETLTEVRSANFNGVYKIHKNQDGTLNCSCPSFMKGNGGAADVQQYACKHICRTVGDDGLVINGSSPSAWQLAALKKLNVNEPERLTNDQAYFLINDILAYQGVTYSEYERILREYGKVSVLPILPMGVEFEGYVPDQLGHSGLRDRLISAGLPCATPGYSHNMTVDRDSGRTMYKIVPDASLYDMRGLNGVEIVTPKLFGATGFNEIREVLSVWRSANGAVNRNCGCHVHIDAYNYDRSYLLELMKIWAKIEKPILWFLVSPSRRHSRWTGSIDADNIRHLAGQGARTLDRYLSLNVAAFHRYKTVEFRLHQGTMSSRKIVSWIIFLMKLVEAVRNGLTYRDVAPDLESVFNVIGMDETATGRIRQAREYLTERYEFWKRDADENPAHVPQVDDIDLEAVERDIERIVANSGRRSARQIPPGVRNNILGVTSTIAALATTRTAVEYTPDVPDPDAHEYSAPAVRGNSHTLYTITRHGGESVSESDTLSCTCRGFRSRLRCCHTVSLARALGRVINARRRSARRQAHTMQDTLNAVSAAGR